MSPRSARLRHCMNATWLATCLVASVLVGAQAPPVVTRMAPDASPTPVAITAKSVVLNPEDANQRAIGRFAYAGGVDLIVEGRFGGLSDLAVLPDLRMMSVTDEGHLVEARLVLDGDRLAGITGFHMRPLVGLDGAPLPDKTLSDAEGLAVFPNGDRLVSFERNHRIWRYPADGSVPVPVPTPPTQDFPLNGGMEALTAAPPLGNGAYLAGSETGTVWLCALQGRCRETALGAQVPAGFGLTGIAVSPDGDVIGLATRLYDPARGVRVIIRLMGRDALDRRDATPLDELVLDAPLTRDNVEGISLVRGPAGATRLYLLTDNNFSDTQHTYLLAFDWKR